MSAINSQDQLGWPLEGPVAAALGQGPAAEAPRSGADETESVLTKQDEAVLREIECGDSGFIDRLIDEIWDAKDWDRGLTSVFLDESGEDLPDAPEPAPANPAAEQSAHQIVREWAVQLSRSRPQRRGAASGWHNRGQNDARSHRMPTERRSDGLRNA